MLGAGCNTTTRPPGKTRGGKKIGAWIGIEQEKKLTEMAEMGEMGNEK